MTISVPSTKQALYGRVGDRVRKAREKLGLTQEALARTLSLSRTSVTNIEKGRQKILLHTFLDIATALKVTPQDLLPIEEETERENNNIEKNMPSDLSRPERAWIKSMVRGGHKHQH